MEPSIVVEVILIFALVFYMFTVTKWMEVQSKWMKDLSDFTISIAGQNINLVKRIHELEKEKKNA